MKLSRQTMVPVCNIEGCILFIRGHKVMLDRHLAALYGVETRALNQAVRRNIERFPADFTFSLTRSEIERISQTVISSPENGALKFSKNVNVFTEQGVAMLSSVLRSPRAVQVNIEIMRAFVRLRGILAAHRDLAHRLDELEKEYDKQFAVVFDAIRELMAPQEPRRRKRMGFRVRSKQTEATRSWRP